MFPHHTFLPIVFSCIIMRQNNGMLYANSPLINESQPTTQKRKNGYDRLLNYMTSRLPYKITGKHSIHFKESLP